MGEESTRRSGDDHAPLKTIRPCNDHPHGTGMSERLDPRWGRGYKPPGAPYFTIEVQEETQKKIIKNLHYTYTSASIPQRTSKTPSSRTGKHVLPNYKKWKKKKK